MKGGKNVHNHVTVIQSNTFTLLVRDDSSSETCGLKTGPEPQGSRQTEDGNNSSCRDKWRSLVVTACWTQAAPAWSQQAGDKRPTHSGHVSDPTVPVAPVC